MVPCIRQCGEVQSVYGARRIGQRRHSVSVLIQATSYYCQKGCTGVVEYYSGCESRGGGDDVCCQKRCTGVVEQRPGCEPLNGVDSPDM